MDFAIKLFVLIKICLIKNQFSIEQKNKDEDISQKFVEMLEKDMKKIQEKFDFSKRIIFTFKDKDDFEKAEICWICQKEFDEREKKVRDHCHFTGKYLGAAHNKCNLQFKKTEIYSSDFS